MAENDREGNDRERRELIYEFYRMYRLLQERYDLRMHSSFCLDDEGLIEIWKYEHGRQIKCVCRVKGESEEECYRKAISELGYIQKRSEDIGNEKKQKVG